MKHLRFRVLSLPTQLPIVNKVTKCIYVNQIQATLNSCHSIRRSSLLPLFGDNAFGKPLLLTVSDLRHRMNSNNAQSIII